jgi:DNA-binding transcriptional MerR regulator
MPGPIRSLTAAQTAQRLGLTVKALRVLERHGLIEPGRTPAGWRAYGSNELARLHQVLALRRLGLSLSRVAQILQGRAPDMARVLALQEDVLLRAQLETDSALRLVRRARTRLAEGAILSTDDLTTLIKETIVMTDSTQTPAELDALIARHYTPEQLDRLKARPFSAEDQARVTTAWEEIYREADRLVAVGANPGCPEALVLARRSRDLIDEFTGGDPGVAASLDRLVSEAASQPSVQQSMPGSPEANTFLAKARVHLGETAGGGN